MGVGVTVLLLLQMRVWGLVRRLEMRGVVLRLMMRVHVRLHVLRVGQRRVRGRTGDWWAMRRWCGRVSASAGRWRGSELEMVCQGLEVVVVGLGWAVGGR